MASEETPLVAQDDPYKDVLKSMTLGRRLARYLSGYKWYNPQLNNPDAPSLDKAWAYFEHVTLPRHFKPEEGATDVNRKAESGENQATTQLYSVLGTPESDLADFGIGVGVYFYTLRMLSVIMLIAGIINMPNLLFFLSDRYNPSNTNLTELSLKASAICTSEAWSACPTCTKEDWDRFPSTYDRYAEALSEDGSVLTFIKINNCNISDNVGLVSYVSVLFIVCAIYFLRKASQREERKFDDAQLTTTDYAVEVVNPPKDARDPEEWKTFFEQFGQVASITVALDNEELITALLLRRGYIIKLEDLQPAGVKVDVTNLASAVETAMASNAKTLKKNIEAIDKKIADDLSKRHYDVSNVFVIFEMEDDQQKALQQMSVGGVHVMMKNNKAVSENVRFRGEHILKVREPPEPSSVRWRDLDETLLFKSAQRLATFALTIVLIIVSCLFVVHVRKSYGTTYAALAISAINTIIPKLCLYITDLESHPSEGSKQASNYVKITAALWTLTTILTAFLTPFTDTVSNEESSLIPALYAIFITELLTSPITQVLDISGNVNRHVLAPRALDQRRMNAYFIGVKYSLSERYTGMTNVLFLTFYFAVLYPAGFFWAAATLAVHYWVDKFCLLRNWAPSPALGSQIAEMSRVYFFSAAVIACAIMSSYNFASFPYDNACKLDDTVSGAYVGSFSGRTAAGDPVAFSVSEGDDTFKFCNQDMLRYSPPAFPAVRGMQPEGGEWMGPGQDFTIIFGWTSVAIMVWIFLVYLNFMRKSFECFFFGRFTSHGKPENSTKTGFSEGIDIYAYIPQHKIAGALFPTLLCDVSQISEELISWEDPSDPTKKSHTAIYDAPGLIKEKDSDKMFTFVKYWQPKK